VTIQESPEPFDGHLLLKGVFSREKRDERRRRNAVVAVRRKAPKRRDHALFRAGGSSLHKCDERLKGTDRDDRGLVVLVLRQHLQGKRASLLFSVVPPQHVDERPDRAGLARGDPFAVLEVAKGGEGARRVGPLFRIPSGHDLSGGRIGSEERSSAIRRRRYEDARRTRGSRKVVGFAEPMVDRLLQCSVRREEKLLEVSESRGRIEVRVAAELLLQGRTLVGAPSFGV